MFEDSLDPDLTTEISECDLQEMDVQLCSSLLDIVNSSSATNFGARHPSAQPIPPIIIPDLTRLITRCCQYPVSGGAYGDIYRCVYHGPGGDVDVGASITTLPCLMTDEVLRKELGIWKRLQHFNILKFMGTTRDFGPSEALVAPWIVNGNLTSFLSQNNENLGLRDRLLLLRDIAAGLNYLHTFTVDIDGYNLNAVIHGDLTGTNVLVDGDRRAYLADFGLSGTLTQFPGMTYLAKTSCHPGALRWTAPELLSAEEVTSASAVTTQSDIYSFGSIVLQVLTGNIPWPHLINVAAILRKVIFEEETHPRPDDNRVTDQHWKFITLCWSKEPDARPSAEKALQFIGSELVLYDRGSIDGGQHPALVPVPGYAPLVIGPVRQNPPFVSTSACGRCALYG
ncbi:kinase-like domain-containing protein [Suillus subalutaceus]|uniref:kinase-like domain-containing protein n=1 Tax=Suillus subalutaceus TaxID=48586 RepID=UPI001B86A953|nr:kinase-like domain-containing protein [Suillus subalutaceus]KAG1870673.1 kinase-like domain-containing protein [Suillus subalutaceus]